MSCGNFCSKKNRYHRTYGLNCDLARISLQVALKPVSATNVEVSYTLKNTGAITLCKYYGICSKLLGKITDKILLVPNQEYTIIRSIPITEDDNPMVEEATAYAQVTKHDWVTSDKVKDTLVDYGVQLSSLLSSSVQWLGENLTMTILITNISDYDATDVIYKVFLSKQIGRPFSYNSQVDVDITGEYAVIKIPYFKARTTVDITIDYTVNLPSSTDPFYRCPYTFNICFVSASVPVRYRSVSSYEGMIYTY